MFKPTTITLPWDVIATTTDPERETGDLTVAYEFASELADYGDLRILSVCDENGVDILAELTPESLESITEAVDPDSWAP